VAFLLPKQPLFNAEFNAMAGQGKPFEKGHRLSRGGARPGAGRPTDSLKAAIEEIGDPLQIIRFYYDVACGADLEQVVTDSGETVRVPAAVKDRLRAGELYLDRRIGKVPQAMEVTGADGSVFSSIPTAELASVIESLRQRVTGRSGNGTAKKAGK
jgi:hypothetical protein